MARILKVFTESDLALAAAIRIALAGQSFEFTVLTDSCVRIAVAPDQAALLEDPSPQYALLQEGGSSTELYVHAHGSLNDAEGDRIDCTAKGSYRTSPVCEISPVLAALGEKFYEAVEGLIAAGNELGYVDASADYASDEHADAEKSAG